MKFKVQIHGDAWTVFFLPYTEFEKRYGTDATAYTITDTRGKREMWFNDADTSIQTIRHEVTHAFMSYQYLGSTKISVDDAEEIFCEIVGNRLEDIRRVSKNIHSRIAKAYRRRS